MRLMRQPKFGLDMPLSRLRDQIDRIFEQPDLGVSNLFGGWTPAVDVLEDKGKSGVFYRRGRVVKIQRSDGLVVGQLVEPAKAAFRQPGLRVAQLTFTPSAASSAGVNGW